MAGDEGMEAVRARVHELEGQVTAFTGLGEALKVVDGLLGRATEELAVTGGRPPHSSMAVGQREVRAVVLA